MYILYILYMHTYISFSRRMTFKNVASAATPENNNQLFDNYTNDDVYTSFIIIIEIKAQFLTLEALTFLLSLLYYYDNYSTF